MRFLNSGWVQSHPEQLYVMWRCFRAAAPPYVALVNASSIDDRDQIFVDIFVSPVLIFLIAIGSRIQEVGIHSRPDLCRGLVVVLQGIVLRTFISTMSEVEEETDVMQM